jgi:hypothetical protein
MAKFFQEMGDPEAVSGMRSYLIVVKADVDIFPAFLDGTFRGLIVSSMDGISITINHWQPRGETTTYLSFGLSQFGYYSSSHKMRVEDLPLLPIDLFIRHPKLAITPPSSFLQSTCVLDERVS